MQKYCNYIKILKTNILQKYKLFFKQKIRKSQKKNPEKPVV